MGVDLRQLEHFVAVVEEGSFTRAARRLSKSQPAMSVAVQQLERRLGGLLVERGQGPVQLTAAGVLALEHAHRVLDAAREMEAAVRLATGGRTRRLRVGLFGTVGPMTPVLLQAMRAVSGLDVTVRSLGIRDQVSGLVDDDLDVVLAFRPFGDERLTVEPLLEHPRVLAVAVHHPLAGAAFLRVEDVLDEPRTRGLSGDMTEWTDWWSLVPERGGEQPRRLDITSEDDPLSQMRQVALHRTVAVLPAFTAEVMPGGSLGVTCVPVADLAPATAVTMSRRDADAVVLAVTDAAADLAHRLSLGGGLPPREVPHR